MKRQLLIAMSVAVAAAASAQWSADVNSPAKVFPTGMNSYATEVKAGPDGTAWAVIYHPNTDNAGGETDIANVKYEYRLQHFDRDGKPEWQADGILLSDYNNLSWTQYNDYLLVDNEGNAIVAVSDCRNSSDKEKSITAYKISPKGEMLWGEDGVAVSDAENPAHLVAAMKLVELDDHSVVFAWSELGTDDNSRICLQRISKEGKALWGKSKVWHEDEYTVYPYLVPSGDNTFIMVYARTQSQILYAAKLDFECENVWGKETRIYRGGWGTVPLYTLMQVVPSGDNGVLVAWSDDRANSGFESPYISYVTTDGKLGFEGLSDEGDMKLGYFDAIRCLNVAATPAADGNGFYAIWRGFRNQQSFQGIYMQYVNLAGDLVWGDHAKAVCPIEENSYAYLSIQPMGEDGACAFYEHYSSYFDQCGLAVAVNPAGEYTLGDGPFVVTPQGRMCTNLKTQIMPGQDAYLLTWTDGGAGEEDKEKTYCMARMNQNGTFGLPESGVNEMGTASDDASIEYYNVAGMRVMSPVKGVTIVRRTMQDGTVKSEKLIR